jgi:outer membrane protein TolC
MNLPKIPPLLLLLPFAALADTTDLPLLSPGEALRTALENNHGIKIAANNAEIARLNNAPGNAGMLPYASIIATDNVTNTTPPLGGPEALGRQSNALNVAARIDWTLFDGGRMFISRERLSHIESIGALAYREAVLQTQADVITAYYRIVGQKQQLAFINEVIALNRERVSLAQTSFIAGLAPKTVLLQSTIDLNVYREKALEQQNNIRASKRAFNVLLCREDTTGFEVVDTIALAPHPDRTALLEAIDSSSIPLRTLQQQIEIATLNLRESRASMLPKFSVNAGYGVSHNNTGAGSGAAWGPQAGASLTIPLYQGGNIARQVNTSRLSVESARQQQLLVRRDLRSKLGQLIDDYENQLQILQIERENGALARENLEISMQRMRLGQSTMIELRLAEESYADSRTRLLSIELNLKAAETSLKLLTAAQ